MDFEHNPPISEPTAMAHSKITGLPLLHRGKVRDLYAINEQLLLLVTTDRISAYDVVMPQAIPGKGQVLHELSLFWCRTLQLPVAHHYVNSPTLEEVLPDTATHLALRQRAAVTKRLRPLPIEAIVRGYLAGSGWQEYQEKGSICGIPLAPGLRRAERLPEPIFTPSTKAAPGEHDRNIGLPETLELLGEPLAHRIRELSLDLYRQAAAYAAPRGLLIADTKFEFGLDEDGKLHLIDEVLTPDSSRFWASESYQPGREQPSFDKQYLRDYLDRCGWNREPPAPELPAEVIHNTRARYQEAATLLLGSANPTAPSPS